MRALEQTAATLTADDLATGQTVPAINYMADPVELKLLHMITGDPKRNPSAALFGNPDFWYSAGSADCGTSCFSDPQGQDAWNHGDVAPEINTTFLGLAGPGVEHQGVNNSLWSDHTDIQPTMWALLALHADYAPDGRPLLEVIDPATLPGATRSGERLLVQLGELYKQLDAPVGAFGLDTLKVSTVALASRSPGDATYTALENELSQLGTQRDGIASAIQTLLLGATFAGQPVNAVRATGLINAGEALLARVAHLAG